MPSSESAQIASCWLGIPQLDIYSDLGSPRLGWDRKKPDSLASLLLMTAIRTAFSLSLLLGTIWTASRFPDCHRWVLFTCRSLTLSLSFCCFTDCSNLSPWPWGFCRLAHGARGPGEWVNPDGKCWPLDPDSPLEISANFIPLDKPNFSPVWHGPPPSRWLPFGHYGTKMGSLDIYPVYSVSHYHIYTSHIKIPLQHVSV